MSEFSILKDGEVYTAQLARTIPLKCGKIFDMIEVCGHLKVKADGMYLCLKISSFEYCLKIASSGCVELRLPFSVAKLKICVSDFKETKTDICARIKVTGCYEFLWWTDCTTIVNKQVCVNKVDTLLKQLQANTKLDPSQQMLLLKALNEDQTESCGC